MPSLDFYNRNAAIDYPLVTNSEVPSALLVDAGFLLESYAEIFLTQIRKEETLSFTFLIDGEHITFTVALSAPFGTIIRNSSGYLCIGDISKAPVLWEGAVAVQPGRVVALYPGVNEFACFSELDDDGTASRYHYVSTGVAKGDVVITPGHNITALQRADTVTLAFSLSAGAGELCHRSPLSEEAELTCGAFLRALSNVLPNDDGVVYLTGVNGVQVRDYPEQHKIVVDMSAVTSNVAFCGV